MQTDASWHSANLKLDRVGSMTLSDQIASQIESAILEGALLSGSRLPSWRDLSAQLGVARGTVKVAYERLIDRGLLFTAGSAGTRVVEKLHVTPSTTPGKPSSIPKEFDADTSTPLAFQMGVPAHDAFPATVWTRLYRQAVQATSLRTGYSDPRGLADLRSAIASHVTIGRGVECSPDQVIVTTGFRGGLALVLQAFGMVGQEAWVEDPGYPITRLALEMSGMKPIAIPVDAYGIDVDQGRSIAPQATLAIVTPGQQAPTGVPLADHRRAKLVHWATSSGSWIVEDDYLADLHLGGRVQSALASGPGAECVIHIGTFSKTIAPMVGLGFVIAPPKLARRLVDVATWLSTPPNIAVQLALATFLRDGHYLRHLRKMRWLYGQRRRCLAETLASLGLRGASPAGLSVLLPLPDHFDDERLALAARSYGLAPAPLSPWFASASGTSSGLLLAVANVLERNIAKDCQKLSAVIKGAATASKHQAPV